MEDVIDLMPNEARWFNYTYHFVNGWYNIVSVISIIIGLIISGPFYSHGLTLIPAWISNYTHYNVWDEITYPFLNFNSATVEV